MIEWMSILAGSEIQFPQTYDQWINLASQILAVVIGGALVWASLRWRRRYDSQQMTNLMELRYTAYRDLLAIMSEYEVTHILSRDFGSGLERANAYGSPIIKTKIDPLIAVSILDLQKDHSFPETMSDLKDALIKELSQPEETS